MYSKSEKRITSLPVALGLVGLLCAGGVPARALAGAHSGSPDQQEAVLEGVEGAEHPDYLEDDDYACSCVETYMGGAEASVSSCDDAAERCADMDVLLDCAEDPDGPDCDYLRSCECDCTARASTTEFEHGPFEDVFLTGIPDLWQFDFMCGSNAVSANAVGCGPVAAAMVMYWWAQQGYAGLVDDFLVGNGSGPAEQEHDWQNLVRELRADYLAGGICVPFGGGQYATLMGKMTTGLEEYIEDAGYTVAVDHWKVCDDCTAGAADEIQGNAALDLIQDELEAGRPVIMGFNTGTAFYTSIPVLENGTFELIYAGPLSNGAPVNGIINHYAVITGYRRPLGLDVLTLNLGWHDGKTDVDVLWNPGGKWLHLYTVDITSAPDPDGEAWCSIDRGVDTDHSPPIAEAFSQPYIEISHVEQATPSATLQLTALAGTSCGIAREGEWVTYHEPTHQLETCLTVAGLPEEKALEFPGGVVSGGTDRGTADLQGGAPILDQELPLP